MARHEVDLWNRALGRIGETRLSLGAEKTVASATAANPVVATVTAHGYATDDLVLLTEMDEMTEVNNRVFKIEKVDADSFKLLDEDGTGYTPESTGGKVRKLPSSKPSKVCFEAWAQIRDAEIRSHPWNSVTRRTRLARLEGAKTITGASQANPVVITTSGAHGYATGDQVLIEGIVGMVELNDRFFDVGNTTSTTFELVGEDGTSYAAYGSAGTVKKALDPLTPDFGYGNRYTLPADCERVLQLLDSTSAWEVEGGELLTDDGETVPIRYIRRLLDVSQYDAALTAVLVARLAAEAVEEITQSARRRELALAEYDRVRARATGVDALEQSPTERFEDSWIDARR